MAITAALTADEASVPQGRPARLYLLLTNTGGSAVDIDSVTFRASPINPSVVIPLVVFPPGTTKQIAGSNGTLTIGVDVFVNGYMKPDGQLTSAGFVSETVTDSAGTKTITASNAVQVAVSPPGAEYIPTRDQGSLHFESNRQSDWIPLFL